MDNYLGNNGSDDTQAGVPSVVDRFKYKKSKIWEIYKPVTVDGAHRVECRYCGARYSCKGKGGGQLWRHYRRCQAKYGLGPSQEQQDAAGLQHEYGSKFHKGSSGDRTPVDQHIEASPPRDTMDPMQQNISSAQACPDVKKKFDQESSYQELTRMISLHGSPLFIVKHEEIMRYLAKSLNPSLGFEDFSIFLFQERKVDLKKKIALSSHRVSLSACLWSHESDALVKYLCLAVHFIDSYWKLEKRIIKFGVFQPSPTNLDRIIHFKEARALDSESGAFNVIWEAIRDWNLDRKLFSLTCVNEIRNDERTSNLKNFLIQRKCFPIGGELCNTACLDGVLNIIVSKGQPVLNLAGDILDRFIEAQMSSSLAQQKLKEVARHMELKSPEEDARLWHKIYFGLEVLLHFKNTFPSEELVPAKETEIIESVCKILRAIYHAVEVFSGPICPTANMYFNELWIVRTTLEEQASTDHTELSRVVWEMQEALDEFWQNSYVWLSVPVVFDPRFKFAFIEFHLKLAFGNEAPKYVSVVHDTIWELFVEYCSSVDKPSVDTSICETRAVQVDEFYSDSSEDPDKHLTVQIQITTELKEYLDDDLVPRNDDFNIMNWWMTNSAKYPTLSVMARDILAMPGSAVHCEEALSSKGPAISKHWSKLNIKTIEALVCIRDWIK